MQRRDDGGEYDEGHLIIFFVGAAEEVDLLAVRSAGGAGVDGISNAVLAEVAAGEAEGYKES